MPRCCENLVQALSAITHLASSRYLPSPNVLTYLVAALMGLVAGCTSTSSLILAAEPGDAAQHLDVVLVHVKDGKAVYVENVDASVQFATRYWPSQEGPGAMEPTLEMTWERATQLRYQTIRVGYSTDPGKWKSWDLRHDGPKVQIQYINEGADSFVRCNVQDVVDSGGVVDHVELTYNWDETLKDLNERVTWQGAYALNARAWVYATCPINDVRNGEQALDDAARAMQMRPSSSFRDTLAAAYGEFGDFESAAREATIALGSIDQEIGDVRQMEYSGDYSPRDIEAAVAELENLRAVLPRRIANYRAGKPVREWCLDP